LIGQPLNQAMAHHGKTCKALPMVELQTFLNNIGISEDLFYRGMGFLGVLILLFSVRRFFIKG